MSVIDILTRVDAICKKYDKYDIAKQKESNVSGEDAFARLYAVVEADIEAAEQKVEAAAKEKNRASAVAMNAEVRWTKARLLEEVPKSQRLAMKKVKGVSSEEFAARSDLHLRRNKQGVGQPLLLLQKLSLIPVDSLMINTFNNLKHLASSGKSMRCGR